MEPLKSFASLIALPASNASDINSVNILEPLHIFLEHCFLQTDPLPSSPSWLATVLNLSNNSTRITGFSVTQNIRKLFLRNFRKQQYCGNTLSILCVKICEANCSNIFGNHHDKHGRNWIICLKVNMTAGNDFDWLSRILTLQSRYDEVEGRYFLSSGFCLPGTSSSYPTSKKSLIPRPLQNLAPVVRRLDNAIHRINCYPVDNNLRSWRDFARVLLFW